MSGGDERRPLPAFAGCGIEIEYMIVERDTLRVLPITDQLLRAEDDAQACEVARGRLGWSNELVLHVLEVKNRYPANPLPELAAAFHSEVRYLNRRLELYGARLMPGAMHPFMDPRRETRLWPHGNAELYAAYARIFDCFTHGWANLQSMQVNLPFAGDAEFARLHAAVRLLLPILPALAASSPIADGADTGFADYRMAVYCDNAGPFTTIAGEVIPETVSSRAEYEERILAPMYREIAAHDPDRLLQQEWLNSRGAIARFDRSAIEIRVIDSQECVQADLAIAAAAVALAQALYRAGAAPERLAAQQAPATGMLAAMLGDCLRHGEQAMIHEVAYLKLLGYPGSRCRAGELWRHLLDALARGGLLAERWQPALRAMLEHGPLARRILRAAGPACTHERLLEVYRELCACLQEDRMFIPL